MEKWALAIGDKSKECSFAIQECRNHGICVRKVNDVKGAVEELAAKNNYLLLILFPKIKWTLDDIRTIRSLTGAPVLVLADKYDGRKKSRCLRLGRTNTSSGRTPSGKGLRAPRHCCAVTRI